MEHVRQRRTAGPYPASDDRLRRRRRDVLRHARRRVGAGRCARRGRLPRVALDAAGARPRRRPAHAGPRAPRRAVGRLHRRSASALRGQPGGRAHHQRHGRGRAPPGRRRGPPRPGAAARVTADRPPELQDVGAPQTIDQTHLFGRAVRWFAEPGVPDAATRGSWRSLGARAVAAATGVPPGPVHLNLAFREPLVGTAGDLPPARGVGPGWPEGRPWTTTAPGLAPPTSDDAFRIQELSGAAGVIVAGLRCGAADRIHRLAAALGWPVLADPRSGCRTTDRDDGRRRPTPSCATATRPSGSGPRSCCGWASRPPRRCSTVARRQRRHRAARPRAGRVDRPRPPARPHRRRAAERVVGPAHRRRHPGRARVARRVAGGRGRRAAGDRRRARASTPSRPSPAWPARCWPRCPTTPGWWWRRRCPSATSSGTARPRAGVWVEANRGANGIDGVVSTAVGVALVVERADRRARRRPRLPARHHRAASASPPAGRPHDRRGRQRRRRHLLVPAAGSQLPSERFEQLFGTPHGVDIGALGAVHGLRVTRPERSARRRRRRSDDALGQPRSRSSSTSAPTATPTSRSTTSSTPRSPPPSSALGPELRDRAVTGRTRAREHGLELGPGLGQLGGGVGVGDDAVAGVDAGGRAVDAGAADGDRPGAVAGGVDPAHRTGVAAAVEPLELGDDRERLARGADRTPPGWGAGPARARAPTRAGGTAGPRPGWPGAARWPARPPTARARSRGTSRTAAACRGPCRW